MAIIDLYSSSTVPIEMFFGQTPLSFGTGFVWEDAGQFFLITNWHNVTGIDPFSGDHISPTAGEPDRMRVWWNRKGRLGERLTTVEILRDTNGPLWWVHPRHGNQIDVIALPINPHADAEMYPINGMPSAPLFLAIGSDVFVLGYPFGIGPGGLPIWKRGSIASEPEFINHQHHIFLDTASRPGMSGSPIIRRSWGTHFYEDGGTSSETGSIATRFVGVYSGLRIPTKPPGHNGIMPPGIPG